MIIHQYAKKTPLIQIDKFISKKIYNILFNENTLTHEINSIRFILSEKNTEINAYFPNFIDIINKQGKNNHVSLIKPKFDLNDLINETIVDAKIEKNIKVINHNTDELEKQTSIKFITKNGDTYDLDFIGRFYGGRPGVGHPLIYETIIGEKIYDTLKNINISEYEYKYIPHSANKIHIKNNKLYFILSVRRWSKNIDFITSYIKFNDNSKIYFNKKEIVDYNDFEISYDGPSGCYLDYFNKNNIKIDTLSGTQILSIQEY